MQTFLPYPDFVRSAAVLDNSRLGSQINECQIILDTLHEVNNGGYYNHPIVRMWKFYEFRLAEFGLACEDEWEKRGYKIRKNRAKLERHLEWAEDSSREYPMWFGDEALHQQWRRILLWKNPLWYNRYWPEETSLDPKSFVYP